MRRDGKVSLANFIIVLALVLLNAGQGYSYILTITSSGNNVNFQQISPSEGQSIIPYATQIVVVSSSGNYSLSAKAEDNLIKTTDATKTIPIAQLQWAEHTPSAPTWTSFGTISQTIASGGTTTSTGIIRDYDYKLLINWTDYPGDYHGTITYSVTSGFLENSFSTPNPFSPNGDGTNDITTISYYLDDPGTITVTIRDIDEVVIKTLLDNATQTSGAQSVVWDGSNGSGTTVADNDYKYLISDNSTTIGSGIITLARGTSTGTATVCGKVRDAGNNNPISDATIFVYESSGNFVGSTTSNYIGDYSLGNLSAGYYYLVTTAGYYYPKTSTTFYLTSGQTLTKDILLDHNTSLLVIKQTNVKSVQTGDIITYTIRVKNIGHGGINQIKIVDKCPYNFKYIRNTSKLNSNRLDEPIGNNPYTWEIGSLTINGERILSYHVLVGIDAKLGDQRNVAEVSGITEKEERLTTTVFAIVRVREGTFRNHGIILGKVYEDINGDRIQQKGEAGVGKVNIIMEDGMSVTTDDEGRYSIPGVKPGEHLFMIDPTTLAGRYGSLIPQSVYLPTGGLAKLDFCLLPVSFSLPLPPVFIGLASVGIGQDVDQGQNQLSFYLNTSIYKKYQLTTSFDTRRTIENKLTAPLPEDYYPIYGDKSTLINKTPSSEPLFLRLQSKDMDILYGDYALGFGGNRLSAYQRTLTGARIEMGTASHKIIAFGACTKQVKARDSLSGRGINGPYYLTNYPIVDGSEKIRIEMRDQRNSQVFTAVEKERGKDYSLDYDTGRLIFDKPVPSFEGGIRYYIIVFYEYIPLDAGYKHNIYGFRGVINPYHSLKLGTTYVREEQSPFDYCLYGVDGSFSPQKEFTIKAEYAETNGDLKLSNPKINNSAYVIETLSSLKDDTCRVKTFYHHTGDNFSNTIDAGAPAHKGNLDQYIAGYYDITTPIPQKGITTYGSRIDYQMDMDKSLFVQMKTSDNSRDRAETNILGFGYNQIIHNSTLFANLQEEKEAINRVKQSVRQIFTIGDKTVIGRHDLGLKYSRTDIDNQAITHSLGLNLLSRYDRISPSIQYELTDNLTQGRHTLKEYRMIVGAGIKPVNSIQINTSYTLGIKSNCLEGTKTRATTLDLGVGYSPYPWITLSTANKTEKETDATSFTTESFGIDLTPTDKTKLSAKNEIREGQDRGKDKKTISRGAELKQRMNNNMDTSLKYSSVMDEKKDNLSLFVVDLTQRSPYGLTTYGKYTYERNGTGTCSPDSSLLLASAYRSPLSNRFNLLIKCEIADKKALTSIETIYTPTNRWSLFTGYAMRKVRVEDITSCIEMINGRLTHNITKRLEITTGYRILYQHLTNDYRINPIVELGFGFNNRVKAILGYNLVEYWDEEIEANYSTRGYYLRINSGLYP